MITLENFPRNKEKFIRLIEFFKEILQICIDLDIEPILDGSLGVFAYTKNPGIEVNDIDLSVPEGEYHTMMKALDAKGIGHKLREWHVLQVIKDDLKIELGSIEYWYKDLVVKCDLLQVDDYTVKILSLDGLKELYTRGLEYTANNLEEGNNKIKNASYKVKLAALNSIV